MHELRRTGGGDPDKTKPPTRVEDLWGVVPSHASVGAEQPQPPSLPPSTALSNEDALTLYHAARDCMVAGAYTGATALLRRLVLHVAVQQANTVGTREDAERLFGVAETLLGLGPDHEPPSNA